MPFYKVPFLISLTVAMVLIAIIVARAPIEIAGILIGSFIGTFFLDIEYFLSAYLFEPQTPFSQTLMGFVKHKDFLNAVAYINYHKDEIKDKSLNSAVFQVVIAAISIFIAFASVSFLFKALIFSIYANSIYRFSEAYFQQKTDDWFWALKTKPTKRGTVIYAIGLIVILVFCIMVTR